MVPKLEYRFPVGFRASHDPQITKSHPHQALKSVWLGETTIFPIDGYSVLLKPFSQFSQEEVNRYSHMWNRQYGRRDWLYPTTPDNPDRIRDWFVKESESTDSFYWFTYIAWHLHTGRTDWGNGRRWIEQQDCARLVGHIGITELGDHFNLTYYNGTHHDRNRGITSKAVKTLMCFLVASNLEWKIRARVNSENIASQKVLGKFATPFTSNNGLVEYHLP